MIVTVEEAVELVLPAGWRELPPAHVMATDDWMWEWVECTEVACDKRETFTRSLVTLSRIARAASGGGRTWILLSGPALGTAAAGLAAISLVEPTEADTVPDFLVPGGVGWWRSESATRVPFGDVAEVHDILVSPLPGTDESLVVERYIGTVTSSSSHLKVRLEMFSPSVDAFGDIVAAGESALDGLRFA